MFGTDKQAGNGRIAAVDSNAYAKDWVVRAERAGIASHMEVARLLSKRRFWLGGGSAAAAVLATAACAAAADAHQEDDDKDAG